MRKVFLCYGLPGSGKTTWAKQMIKDNPGRYKRVNKDDLRAMIDDGKFNSRNENFVLGMRDGLITKALDEGYDVIVDDTNLHPKHEAHIRAVVDAVVDVLVEIVVQKFDTPLNECIERDAKREKPVGKEVILKMHNQFIKKEYKPTEGYPKAFIFDIDGTLAKMERRGPFEWDLVSQDKVCEPVAETLRALRKAYFKIIIFSGRDGVCSKDTLKWLEDNDIVWDEFFIRPEGNTEKDYIVKRRMFDQVSDRYQILGVFDDRPQVVRMWKEMGLHVFDCGDGIEF